MLKDNIKTIRKSKGLSQEELAIKLNVVRQTISKWEQGLSVPDSELLVSLSDALDTPVSTLLGENVTEQKEDSLQEIAEKLEIINLQLAQKKETKRKIWHLLHPPVQAHFVSNPVSLYATKKAQRKRFGLKGQIKNRNAMILHLRCHKIPIAAP